MVPLSATIQLSHFYTVTLPSIGLSVGVLWVVRSRLATILVLGAVAASTLISALLEEFAMVTTIADAVSRLLLLAVLTVVVGSSVLAPGPVTFHRVLGAIAVYLQTALIFTVAYQLVMLIEPGALMPLRSEGGTAAIGAQVVYFSFSTLTSVGYGDIVPIHPFARALANLESVIGQLYPATMLARIITLELEQRRQKQTPPPP